MKKEDLHGFVMPEKKIFPTLTLRKLSVNDAQVDFEAVSANKELIRRLIGVNWPGDDFNYNNNRADIARHEKEFLSGKSYTFGVWDPQEEQYLGCLYFYRQEKPWFNQTIPDDCDVVIEFWVTQAAFDQGKFQTLYENVNTWLISPELPFKKPHFHMQELPK